MVILPGQKDSKVVNLIFDKLKSVTPSQLIELLDVLLPEITTNVPTGEFLELIALLPQMSRYEIVSWGIPDDKFKYITIKGDSYIGIDFNYYIDKIYNTIYG